MNRRRRLWIAVLLIVLAAIGILVRILVFPPSPEPYGRLLITRSENGTGRSYWLDPADGSLVTVPRVQYLGRPDLSPDGSQVVYSGWPGLYIYDLTTHTVQQITDAERDSHAVWSPDGRSIIFVNSRDFFSALYRYDVVSGQRQQLTDYQNDLEPDWSPDGQRVVFTTSRDGFQELYTMRPDGTDLQRLTNNTGLNDLLARYSPDGRTIAYMTNYSVGDDSGEIWVMNADGTQQRQITRNSYYDSQPIWSPNGRYIVFTGATPDTSTDLFVYDFQTEFVRQITAQPTIDAAPVWSPDSEWIAFVSYTADGLQSRIYIVRPDGSSLRPLVAEHRGYSLDLWMPASQ
ncbi:MAG: PD40 domain-containing protein [Anaerolineae bacterium]|nr:PD40 domain-containing protein [Anaerolineae bacterium]